MLPIKFAEVDLLVIDCDGVLTDNRVWLTEEGVESVAFSRADGLAFNTLKKLNVPTVILSTETNKVVSSRGKKLGVSVYQGVESKKKFIEKFVADRELSLERTVYVGNDINDFSAMSLCGLSFCPDDAHPMVKELATVKLSTKGGHGVIREILEDHFNINIYKLFYE